MKLKRIQLEQFRSHRYLVFTPGDGINVILGANGAGKTNLLEAIAFFCSAKGFRAAKKEELISFQDPLFRLTSEYENDQHDHLSLVEMAVHRDGQTRLFYNGAREKNVHHLPERLVSIVFTPDDLSLIKEGPTIRRDFLDKDLLSVYPYLRTLRLTYDKTLAQRNQLLKEARKRPLSSSMRASFDLPLAKAGAALVQGRLKILSLMVPEARKIHRFLAPEAGELEATYQSTLGQVAKKDASFIESVFLRLLEERKKEEVLRGMTLSGPHRDDLILYLNGEPARLYASQGQQRTIVLSLKLAMVQTMTKILGRKPLLLLDDVFSELDRKRREALLRYVEEVDIQTFITATDIANDELKSHRISSFKIEEGKIIQKK